MKDGNATIYKLRHEIEKELASGVVELTMKTPETPAILQQNEKVIMVVGATGTGKSTLINRMINYILGVKYTDEFRFQLVIEKDTPQTESQTKIITKYVLHGSTFNYKLSIIDTPGFGDTTGEEEDRKTTEKIQSLFQSGTIVSLDAICFVTKYGNVRLTDFEKYVFKKVTNIFGKDVGPNVFVMATCCDDIYDENNEIDPAPVLEAFKKLEIPYHTSFPFTNKNIYKKPVEGKKLNYCTNQWETSTISFNLFFEELNTTTTPVSLTLTNEVLMRQHNIIHVRMPEFVRNLKQSIENINESKELIKKLKETPKDADFTVTVEVQKEEMVPIKESGIFCIICNNCSNKVCHDPCDVPNDKPIKNCSIFAKKWFKRDTCLACPRNCPWTVHKRSRMRPGFVTRTETHTSQYLKDKYLKGQELNMEKLIKSCEEEMVSAFGKMLNILKTTQEDIDYLNIQCLSKDPTSLEENMESIIKQELETKEDGYDQRMVVLTNLISSMKDVFKNFEHASDRDKVEMAKDIFKANLKQ